MLIKNKMIEINNEDIFANDILGRRQSIIDLSNLITSYNEPFVLSINADWGAGKTTFLKLWKAYLKKEHEVNSIYFSAWEDDFSKEPLIAILGEINNYIEDNSCSDNVKSKFDTVKKTGSKIFKRALPAFIKGATMGIVDVDKGFEAALGALSEEAVSELIDNYNSEKKLLEEFKESMTLLIKEINEDKPFVIFIDELDRCRPLYAIELLERLKHIFGVDNLIFILAIDKKQLSESIKSQYGKIDANKYLKRFIDLEYNMKNLNVETFCDVLYHKYNFDATLRGKGINANRNDYHHLSIMKKLAVSLNLSLRDIEQVFTKLHIVFKAIEPGLYESHFRVFVLFEMIRAYDSELYEGLIYRQENQELIKNTILPVFKTNSNFRDVSTILEASIDAVGKNSTQYIEFIQEKQRQLEGITDTESPEYAQLKNYVATVDKGLGDFGDYNFNDLVETVIKKLEFAEAFNLSVVQ